MNIYVLSTHELLTYDIKWTRFIYILQKCDRSAPYKIREQTDFPHPGSSGATVKAGVTKDDARDPSKRHAISRSCVTTLGEPFR